MKNKIVNYLISKGYVQEDKRNIIYYGLYVIQLNLFTDLVALFIAAVFQEFYFGIVFLIFFDALRVFWGGYHAKNPTSCFISFIIIFIINMFIFRYLFLEINKMLIIILLIMIFLTPSFETKSERIYKKNERMKKILCGIFVLVTLIFNGEVPKILLLSLITNCCLHYYERIRRVLKVSNNNN